MTALYHFTAAYRFGHLGQIMRDGRILPTESNCSSEVEHAGPDVVWLLDLPSPWINCDGQLPHGLSPKCTGRITVEVEDAVPYRRWAV